MLILKSTHKALLDAERKQHAALIAQLKEQISDLRRLVFVPTPSHMETLPVRTANAILDGVEVMPQENAELEADMRQANRIFSGDYNNVEDTW